MSNNFDIDVKNNFSIRSMVKYSLDIFRIIFIWSLLGFLISLIYVYVAPNKFEVHGVIQIDKKYTNYQAEPITLDRIEARLVSLLNPDSQFFNDITFLNICQIASGVSKDLIKKEIRDGYMYLSFYSRAKEPGLDCMDLILKKVAQYSINELNRMVKVNQATTQFYNQRIEEITSQMKKQGISEIQGLSAWLLFQSEIFDLKNKLNKLQIYNESLVGILKNSVEYNAYANDYPVSPNIKKSISLGLLLGGVFGYALHFLKKKIVMKY